MRSILNCMTATVALLILAVPVMAQEAAPQKRLSPAMKASGTIGGSTISVDYSAPSMRGRKIMGALVPYDKVWRTGANEATTLKTDADLMIGNVAVPKGTYTLYTIPGENAWTLIINKQTGQWGTNYNADQDLGRVPMTVKTLKAPVETFVIAVEPLKGKNGTLKMSWENTEVSVPVTVK